jgi:hypothetical protein
MVDRSARFEREKQQGLRGQLGSFIGDPEAPGLHIVDFCQGYQDAKDRAPFPENPTPSYEIGRTRAQEDMEEARAVNDWLKADEERRDAAMRDMLKDRPDLLADWEAKMAEIRNRKPA